MNGGIQTPGQYTRHVVAAATATLTAFDCSNTIISNYGQLAANTQTLPTCGPGLSFRVIIATSGAGAFHLKAGPSDKLYLATGALDDGDKLSLAAPAVGNCLTGHAFQTGASSYDWWIDPIFGLWVDGGA